MLVLEVRQCEFQAMAMELHFTILMKQDFQDAHPCKVPRRAVNDRKASASRAQILSQADAGRS
jgi:hypothetical protein